MSKKNISKEKIVQSFLTCAFEKSAGATSLADISEILEIKKASLYNHFESRDDMYESTLTYCKVEMDDINFLPEKTLDTISSGKTTVPALFKRLITRFFNLYENEPLFAMYTFISSEKYFNVRAMETYNKLLEKISSEIKVILSAFAENGKLTIKSEKDIKDEASLVASVILQQMDSYITNRKETVRQNPDCSAGSLFALPTDDAALTKAVKLVETLLKPVVA